MTIAAEFSAAVNWIFVAFGAAVLVGGVILAGLSKLREVK